MARHPLARTVLAVLLGFVAATAIAGGIVLVVGSLWADARTDWSPPPELLVGSPFSSYLVPGAALAILVGGLHATAFVLVLRRHARALLASTVAAYSLVVWIVVQMTIIPFSPLQAVYLATGLAEIGVVLLLLGVLHADVERAVRAPQRVETSSRGRVST